MFCSFKNRSDDQPAGLPARQQTSQPTSPFELHMNGLIPAQSPETPAPSWRTAAIYATTAMGVTVTMATTAAIAALDALPQLS